jgi:hypothetical protein
MPPKGSKKALAKLGRVVQHGNGFRVEANINRRTQIAPCWTTRAKANKDLRRVQSALTQEEYGHILQQLWQEANAQKMSAKASGSGDSGVGQPAAGAQAVAQSANNGEEGLRIFILREKYLQLVLEGVKTLEIRGQKRDAGPAYIGTSTPPRVYAKILLGEPFPIKTVEHWRELANKHHASDFKGNDKLPYAKTLAFPILEVHKLGVSLPFVWKHGWVGYGKFNLPKTTATGNAVPLLRIATGRPSTEGLSLRSRG